MSLRQMNPISKAEYAFLSWLKVDETGAALTSFKFLLLAVTKKKNPKFLFIFHCIQKQKLKTFIAFSLHLVKRRPKTRNFYYIGEK